ncbi:hypothetical protein K488DRAFT_68440 [Vararia minispora EC-137]|uniref:Uncharacterized protein n=1 Tax=Vararia minispora EC-137 TaxID=1314806 RepID=A0ACB8QUA7_9AGAM|nr:hypothetical protein K488DRAFT_68440 [Vararia minispora EC-137]
MAVQLFIAFYSTGNKRRYHWSLIPSSTGVPSMRRRIKLYEICKERWANDAGTTVTEHWVCANGDKILGASRRFMGMLAFPPCVDETTTLTDVQDILEIMPPMPHGLSEDEQQTWTCAKWIVDILLDKGPIWGLDFVDRMRELDNLYWEIYKLAWRLEEGGWQDIAAEDGAKLRCVPFPTRFVVGGQASLPPEWGSDSDSDAW